MLLLLFLLQVGLRVLPSAENKVSIAVDLSAVAEEKRPTEGGEKADKETETSDNMLKTRLQRKA